MPEARADIQRRTIAKPLLERLTHRRRRPIIKAAAPNLGLTPNIIQHVGPRPNVSVQFASIRCLARPEASTQPTNHDLNEARRGKQIQLGIRTRTEHRLHRELWGKRH